MFGSCRIHACLVSVHVQREKDRSWFNLAAQELQPLYEHAQLDSQGWWRSRGCPQDAWNGGCSLMLDGFIPAVRTSAVCAKCVSPLCLVSVCQIFASSHTHTHISVPVFQDLPASCCAAVSDSGEPHLQSVCWDHCGCGAENHTGWCLPKHRRP